LKNKLEINQTIFKSCDFQQRLKLSLFDWDRREPGTHCMRREISGLLVDLGWKITFGDSKLKMDLPRMGCGGQRGLKL